MKKLLIIGFLLSNIALAEGHPNYIPERNRDVDNSNAPGGNEAAGAQVIGNNPVVRGAARGAVTGAAGGAAAGALLGPGAAAGAATGAVSGAVTGAMDAAGGKKQ